MPLLGNLAFVPIISGLLDIFVCDHSIGDNYSESYMAKDCYQFCWRDEHLIYSIVAAISLVLYGPLAIFCRPLWQELQPMLHIKTTPLHLMSKSVFQVLLIVINKTIKRYQAVVHGVIFVILMFSFAVFSIFNKAFNYPRYSWWMTLSILGVTWESIIATLNLAYGNIYRPL